MKTQPAKIARSKAGNTLKSIVLGERKKSSEKDGAFGRPGIEPRWTHGDKDGVGTSYAASSRIWFTLWNGVITEVYYPTVLRSLSDGRVFDLIPEVANRYLGDREARQLFEIWKPNRQARNVKRCYTLRIQVPAAFRLHWSANEWQSVEGSPSSDQILGFHFVDIPISYAQRTPVRFTFFWTTEDRWEGRDYVVAVE